MLTANLGYQFGLGVDYDLSTQNDAFMGTSEIGQVESFSIADMGAYNRVRPQASAGMSYAVDKGIALTANVSLRRGLYGSQPSVATLLGYRLAL